jgi:presequence protease
LGRAKPSLALPGPNSLERLAREGLDPQTVAASLNTIEFYLRELNSGNTPRGLAVLFDLISVWMYGHDPLDALAFEAPLAWVKEQVAGERFFEDLIERALLANPHRATVLLLPDTAHNARLATGERERLAQARATMGPAELQAIRESTTALAQWQQTPDTPETLATIPALALADIERVERPIPTEEIETGGARGMYHDINTGGIIYLDVGLDLAALPAGLLPYGALFGRLLLETGAGDLDFVQFAQRIGRETGGLRAELFTAMRQGTETPVAQLFLRGKATAERGASLAAIVGELLNGARLDNRERVRQIALEEKAGREAALVPSGFLFTATRLGARLNPAGAASDQLNGAGSLFFLRRLVERIDAEWPAVLAELRRVREILVRRGAVLLNITSDATAWRAFEPHLARLASRLPVGERAQTTTLAHAGPAAEGLVIPAQVNYVAKGTALFRYGYRPHGAALVATNVVSNGWMWEQIRVQGGAYGGWSSYDRRSGVLAHYSYRDPHLRRTLDVFDRGGAFLRETALSPADVTQAIVGTIGEFDVPLLPDAQGFAALTRALTGETHAARQALRDELLGTTAADLRSFAEMLDVVRDHGHVVVLGGQAAFDDVQAERPGWFELTRVM